MNVKRAVRVVLRNDQGKFLVIHTTKNGRNRWEFPGGEVNSGEELQAAGQREFVEETGVAVSKQLTFIKEIRTSETDGQLWDVFFYWAPSSTGTPSVREKNKADAVRWVTPEELANLPSITSATQDVLKAFFRARNR